MRNEIKSEWFEVEGEKNEGSIILANDRLEMVIIANGTSSALLKNGEVMVEFRGEGSLKETKEYAHDLYRKTNIH